MLLKYRKSPNFNNRPDQGDIDMLVLHYTGMKTAEAALERMCDPKFEVSAHYMIDEDGAVYQLVAEEYRAWHAGRSYWRGKEALNDNSIGIEIVNPGHEHGYRDFPDIQMNSVLELSKQIINRHNIPAYNVVAHSDIAPDRKEDPGELFDWKLLYDNGIGLWSDFSTGNNKILLKSGDIGKDVLLMKEMLAKLGYKIDINNILCKNTEIVIKAFKRHYCPEYCNNNWDVVADNVLKDLLEQI